MSGPNNYAVMIERNGVKLKAGHVVRNPHAVRPGWRFYPQFQANPSRKAWPTPQAALRGRVKSYELVATPTIEETTMPKTPPAPSQQMLLQHEPLSYHVYNSTDHTWLGESGLRFTRDYHDAHNFDDFVEADEIMQKAQKKWPDDTLYVMACMPSTG